MVRLLVWVLLAAPLAAAQDPCTDFYEYACADWMKNNPVPPDQAVWGRFNELQERNREILRRILEEAAVNEPKRDALSQKIGDFYSSCMDEQLIEQKGAVPIQPELNLIDALPDKAALAAEVARLHQFGVDALFSFGSAPDAKNSSQQIAQLDQGGLGLPDRDYYLRDDPRLAELRKQYAAHVTKNFELLDQPQELAAAKAVAILRIETALALGALDNASRRDPAKIYHKATEKELQELTPSFAWAKYFSGIGAPKIHTLNVAVPEFFQAMQTLLETASLADWKAYLTWRLLYKSAGLLSKRFVNANFEFYGRTLTGAKELPPRWKRCVSYVDYDLGDALGRKFVEATFGSEGKQRTLAMVQELEKALGEDIKRVDWMTPVTKERALTKLQAVVDKIGYPDRWPDYSGVKIVRGDAVGNEQRATAFQFRRQLGKIGKPVDRREWTMTPPTVNAYYDPALNSLDFPAGILQPPFYDNTTYDAANFGAIGALIGHELTHAFDDEGRQVDAQGNLRDWWTPGDAERFEQRGQCFVDQYSSLGVNGKRTLAENMADNGGVRIALMAFTARLVGAELPVRDQLTPTQRFFLGWGRIWCQNATPEMERLRALNDPHAPPRWRVNGVLQNMPEFHQAFGCQPGKPMVRQPECRVW